MRTILLISTLVCALSASAFADPLNAKAVPAGADLVAHIDLSALRSHSLYSKFLGVAKAEIKKDAIERIVEGLLARVSGVTLWMDSGKEQMGVLVNGIDPKMILGLFALAPDHKVENKDGREVHVMNTKKGQTIYAVLGQTTLHAANDLKTLFSGLDTYGGKLKPASIEKVDMPNTGALLFVAVLEEKLLDRAQKEAASTLIKKGSLKNLVLAIAQQGKDTLVKISARMNSEEEAKRVQEMVQGLLALGSLGVEDANSKRLMSGVVSAQSAKNVTVSMKLTDADILALIKEAQDQK